MSLSPRFAGSAIHFNNSSSSIDNNSNNKNNSHDGDKGIPPLSPQGHIKGNTSYTRYLHIPTSKHSDFLLLLLIQCIFSGWHVLGSELMSNGNDPSTSTKVKISPISFTFTRQVLSSICLVIASWIIDYRSLFAMNKSDLIKIFAAGMFGACFMPLLYLQGLSMTSPTVAAVWDGPILPLLVFVGSICNGVEQISPSMLTRFYQFSSLILSVICSIIVLCFDSFQSISSASNVDGNTKNEQINDNKNDNQNQAAGSSASTPSFLESVLASLPSFLSSSSSSSSQAGGGQSSLNEQQIVFRNWIIGNFVLLLMVTSYAAMAMLQRSLRQYNSVSLTAWMFVIGTVADAIILSLFTEVGVVGSISEVMNECGKSLLFGLGMTYSVLLVTVLNFSLLAYASKRLPSTTISLFSCTQPAITVFLEFLVKGKSIHILQLMSSIGIFVGMKIFNSMQESSSSSTSSSSISYTAVQPEPLNP